MVPSPTLPATKTPEEFHAKLQKIKDFYWQIILIALSAWLLWSCVQTVQRTVNYYTPLPMWDYWRVVEHLESYRALNLSVFWRQHNEHRIVFPEIAFALDMVLLHGRMILPLVLSCLCYCGTWIVLSSTLFADKAMDGQIRLAAILLAGIVGLWQGAANVLGLPFLLQWTLMQLAVALTFLFLSRLRSTESTASLAGTIVSAVIATYSSGNALLLWPLVLCVAFSIRVRKQQLMILSAAATVTLGLYFVRYHFTGDLKLSNFIHFPWYSLEYIGAYLSMPFGAMLTPMFGVRLGLLACITVAFLFVATLANKRLLSPPSVVLFSYWVFTFLTAALTAGGRMDPTDQKFIAAQAFRYLTVPQMNWAVVILLLFWSLSAVRIPKAYLSGLVFVMSLLLFLTFPKLMPWLDGIANFFTEQQLAELSVEDNLHDTYWIKAKIFPDIKFYDNAIAEAKARGVSIYHHGLNRFLGHRVEELGSVQNVPLSGMIAEVLPVESGYEIKGWVDTLKWRRPYTWVVLADEKGTIVGFGRRFAAGLPTAAASLAIPPGLAWDGFISSRLHARTVFAYIEAPRGKVLYRLSTPVAIVPSEIGPSRTAGAPIKDFVWQQAHVATSQALPSKVDFGQSPDTHIASTWNGSDANAETIRSTAFQRPPEGCISIPVLHGPSVGGLSFRIKNAKTGTPVAELPLQAADQQWQYWRVSVEPSVDTLSIEAEDSGKGWGEWIAVAGPGTCK